MHTKFKRGSAVRRAASAAGGSVRTLLWVGLGLALATGTAEAQAGPLNGKLSVHINGGFQSSLEEFRSTFPFSVYGESGRIVTDHRVEGGAIFDAGGYVEVWEQLAVGASYSQLDTSDAVILTGSVPHPLLTGADRAIGPQPVGFEQREQATHIHLAWTLTIPQLDRFDITIMGGPSFFNVTRGALAGIAIRETSPPFMDVTVQTSTEEISGTAWGGHVGADVTYRLTTNVGVGGFVRFTRASVELPLSVDPVSVTVAGLQTGGGIRVRF